MKRIAAIVSLWCLLLNPAIAGSLSEAEVDSLRAEVAAITSALELGDAEELISRTHASLRGLVGGPEAYAEIVRQEVERFRESGIRLINSEIGVPTRTYPAGEEEVCFVPRVTTMLFHGQQVRSTTFMVAVRRAGGEWKYLDGAGLKKRPDFLYRLLPELEPGIPLPLNKIEVL